MMETLETEVTAEDMKTVLAYVAALTEGRPGSDSGWRLLRQWALRVKMDPQVVTPPGERPLLCDMHVYRGGICIKCRPSAIPHAI